MPIDYTDPFFGKLEPQNEQQQKLLYWVMMTHEKTGKPRYGRIPGFGVDPLYDLVYTSIGMAGMSLRILEMSEVADEAARKKLAEMALTAGNATDTATAIGSALLTLEDELVKADEPRIHLQIERTSGGRWIVNQAAHGASLMDAVVAYCERRIGRIRPKKKD